MIELSKLAEVMHQLARDRGPLTLFALFRRDGAPYDKWDLVVSAPYLEERMRESIGEVTDRLLPLLDEREVVSLSRVVMLDPDDGNLADVLRSIQVDDGPMVVRDVTLFGLPMEQGFIFRAKRPPQPTGAPAP